MSTLREDRILFTSLVRKLLNWLAEFHPEAEVAFDEGRVKTPRTVRLSGVKREADDAVHMAYSRHYDGCALDLLLYRNGKYVADGGDELWQDIGRQWESMHSRATWGGRFPVVDSNHVSLESEDGRK